jgi:D-alanyl-D-alanine carboxypeptidase/D-alanyl-D-alanine-endopeptidase (penicillin-binding protein 4)
VGRTLWVWGRTPEHDRIAVFAAMCLLNVFTLLAGISFPAFNGERFLPPEAPAVAARVVVGAGQPVLPGSPGSGPLPSANGLSAGLGPALRNPGLGPSVAAAVADPATGRSLFASRADVPVTPASTTKIVTAVAALAALGPDRRLTTRAVGSGDRVVLVGGGDPTLTRAAPAGDPGDPSGAGDGYGLEGPDGAVGADGGGGTGYPQPASLGTLARRTAAALKSAGVKRVRVDYDASLYTGPRLGPGWKPGYVPEGNVAPVAALEVDGGRVNPEFRSRVSDPPRAAAAAFVTQLDRHGVRARLGTGGRAGGGTRQLAAVHSPPVSALVEHLLTHSDNDVAEALARQVAIKTGNHASFAGAAAGVLRTLGRLGVAGGVQVSDGSGLSTANRISAAGLVRVLSLAASGKRPELRHALTGLPVGGFTGTLAARYGTGGSARSAAGIVRAKTGTLSGVSTLAGIAYDVDGRLLAFAFMADRAPSAGSAEPALDRLAAAVAACGCR